MCVIRLTTYNDDADCVSDFGALPGLGLPGCISLDACHACHYEVGGHRGTVKFVAAPHVADPATVRVACRFRSEKRASSKSPSGPKSLSKMAHFDVKLRRSPSVHG